MTWPHTSTEPRSWRRRCACYPQLSKLVLCSTSNEERPVGRVRRQKRGSRAKGQLGLVAVDRGPSARTQGSDHRSPSDTLSRLMRITGGW